MSVSEEDGAKPPVAEYDFPASVRREFARIVHVAGEEGDSLELQRRVFALDSLRFEPPCTFIMRGFATYKTRHDDWVSKPFYTHPNGYKMRLCVEAIGSNDGFSAHVSVFVQIMWGEFDSLLRWPFRGQVYVELLNRWNQASHREVINFDETAGEEVAGRVLVREANEGWGKTKFISHSELSSMPLKDENCLQFRVSMVVLNV